MTIRWYSPLYIFLLVIFSLNSLTGDGDAVYAHEGAAHTIFDLPACRPRQAVCAPIAEDDAMASNGHCADAYGVARRCDAVAPFSYAGLDKSGREILMAPRLEKIGPTVCADGNAAGFGCQNVNLLSMVPLTDIGDESLADLWGWTDPATGHEYALVGLRDGTAFVDVTAPEEPIYLGKLPSHRRNSQWRDVKVYGHYALIVADKIDHHGVQIFDLNQLATVKNPPVEFVETAWYNGPQGELDRETEVAASHNIAINEESGYAYAVGSYSCAGGLHMIDVREPTQPKFAGCYAGDGYTHDAQCVLYRGPDLAYNGREICFNSNEDTLTVVDVTDKSWPVLLTSASYPGRGYIHQGWLTEDQRYFVSNDEMDELFFKHNTRTYVWDVSRLLRPTLISVHTLDSTSSDHNLYIAGDYIFAANYTSGLRILHLDDLATGTLAEVGYFDTYPQDDERGYRSAWTAYPYFASGTVIVSSIGEGLFSLRPDLPPELTVNVMDNLLATCGTDSAQSVFTLTARRGYRGRVELTTNDVPADVAASFTPPTIELVANGTVTANLTVDWGAAASGPYTLTARARSDTGDETVLPVTLHRAEQVASVPVLRTPADGVQTRGLSPVLTWDAAPDALIFRLEIATDVAFTDVVYAARALESWHTVTRLLKPMSSYYWRVSAENGCGVSAWSEVRSFLSPTPLFLPMIARD